ncbi:MAG: NAD(P)H-hydrate dehydratase [Thiotrichaceae bacterium]
MNLLAQMPFRFFYSILTPHVGEAARLLEISTSEIQADRFAAIASLTNSIWGACVCQGAGSLICNPQGEISVCNLEQSGMATQAWEMC